MTLGAISPITTRLATPADAALLAAVGERSFVDTFGSANTAGDMALYVASAFGEAIQRNELLDARNRVVIAECEGEVAGYAMLRDGRVPECVRGAAIEIARLYSVASRIGTGVGRALMESCLSLAASEAKDVIWLGVWEKNARAIAFYAHWHFVDVGSISFTLGRDVQTDRVMVRGVVEGS